MVSVKLVWRGTCGFAGDESSGEATGGLLHLLVSQHIKTCTVKMPMLSFQPPKKLIAIRFF